MASTHSSLNESERKALEQALPMWKIVFNQFKEHKMAFYSAFVILFFLIVALSAELITKVTGLDPNRQNVGARYLAPMSRAQATDDIKESAVEVYINQHPDEAKKLATELKAQNILIVDTDTENENQDALYDLIMKPDEEVKATLAKLQNVNYSNYEAILKTFSTYHVFGTDEVGRDVLIRLVYGARVSIGVGIMVALSSALIGLLIGGIAGFYGGKIDMALMRVTDALLSLPTIPILIVFSAVDLSKLPAIKQMMNPSYESIIKMFVIMCLFSWMTVARLVRGSILSLREREFVLAAKTLGATDATIILRHMFPNVIAPMLVAITLGVGSSIIYESALSFLGLGIMPPTPSWGNMLNNAQEVIYKNVWLTVLPGLMIFITTVSFNFVGDGLQDAVDPKSIKR
ncbi:MAG: ABC transporter permease [Bdellovibrionaceae bacterium]|nr:ABC transporter permease [Pseudobdellovibrionaceae bacterium]